MLDNRGRATDRKQINNRPALLLSAAWCLSLTCIAPSYAQNAVREAATTAPSRPVAFDIPRQSLEQALLSFSRQANVQVVMSFSEVQPAQSNPVRGRYPRDKALTLLLGSLPFSTEWVGPNTLTVKRATVLKKAMTTPLAPIQQASEIAAESEPPKTEIEEIVVTAQRRSQNLQDVPVAITVASADQLRASGVTGISNLRLAAPGVDVQSANGYALPIIRGVGTRANGAGVENPIAIYVDGVYYAAATSGLLSFNNIAQIEVLKGPQGTLFGRNATGGLIQVTTKDPSSHFEGDADLSYGNYKTLKANLYVTGGIANGLRADIAANVTTMGDGYGTNLVNGKDIYRIFHDVNLRSKWLWDIGPDTQARLIVDYSDTRQNMNVQRISPNTPVPAPYGPTYGGREWDGYFDVQPLVKIRSGGVSLRVDHDFSTFKLASISAYRKTNYNGVWDFDYTATRGRQITNIQKDYQFSQEIQLLSQARSSLSWVLGAFYFNARGRYDPFRIDLFGPAQTGPATLRNAGSEVRSYQDTNSISGFAQATLKLADGLNATGGLRYTSEKRSLTVPLAVTLFADGTTSAYTPPPTQRIDFRKLTWRLALDYKLTPDVLTYISYNRGFKSGGFNPASLTIPPYRPEVLDAYEIGLKSKFFDRRVRFNVAGYFYNYKGLQIQIPAVTGTGIYNGSSAHIYGLDAELEARVTPEFSVRTGYQYIHGRYIDFPLAQIAVPGANGILNVTRGAVSGNTTALSPKSTLSLAANYNKRLNSGRVEANATYYYNSGYFQDPDNFLKQPAYALLNSSVTYRFDKGQWISIWGQNLTDRAYAVYQTIQTLGAQALVRVNYAPPRTYGVTIGTKF